MSGRRGAAQEGVERHLGGYVALTGGAGWGACKGRVCQALPEEAGAQINSELKSMSSPHLLQFFRLKLGTA